MAPLTPDLGVAVIKMPLVFQLHKQGRSEHTISMETGISLAKVRSWLTNYGDYADQITDPRS